MNSEIKVDKPSPSYLKHANNGGLFVGLVYVLVLMSILALALWQNSEVDKKNKAIVTLDERIALLEEQLSLADENNTDSMTGISASLQFLDKEVRKLWDLSNKRNKVDIKKLKEVTELINTDLNVLNEEIGELKELISQTNKDIDHIRKLSKQSNDDLNILKALPIQINNLETKLMLAEDSIQALESYKKQINQTILEIQSEISNLAVDKEVPTVIEDGEGI
jgi:chromosome segregation ATPase